MLRRDAEHAHDGAHALGQVGLDGVAPVHGIVEQGNHQRVGDKVVARGVVDGEALVVADDGHLAHVHT